MVVYKVDFYLFNFIFVLKNGEPRYVFISLLADTLRSWLLSKLSAFSQLYQGFWVHVFVYIHVYARCVFMNTNMQFDIVSHYFNIHCSLRILLLDFLSHFAIIRVNKLLDKFVYVIKCIFVFKESQRCIVFPRVSEKQPLGTFILCFLNSCFCHKM